MSLRTDQQRLVGTRQSDFGIIPPSSQQENMAPEEAAVVSQTEVCACGGMYACAQACVRAYVCLCTTACLYVNADACVRACGRRARVCTQSLPAALRQASITTRPAPCVHAPVRVRLRVQVSYEGDRAIPQVQGGKVRCHGPTCLHFCTTPTRYRGGENFARGEFRGENFAVKKGGEIFPWRNFGVTVPSFTTAAGIVFREQGQAQLLLDLHA